MTGHNVTLFHYTNVIVLIVQISKSGKKGRGFGKTRARQKMGDEPTKIQGPATSAIFFSDFQWFEGNWDIPPKIKEDYFILYFPLRWKHNT